MQSSGGLTSRPRGRPRGADRPLRPRRRRRRGAPARRALRASTTSLCFDMGGTSCDVCVIDGGQVAETGRAHRRRSPARAADARHPHGRRRRRLDRLARPRRRAARRPRSPRAPIPGPACYGRGGELPTVTDANLLLGRLLGRTRRSPAACALDRRGRERAVAALAGELGLDPLACADGIVASPRPRCSRALRVMTVERGIDPRGFALLAFGGAGPLHACALAERARHRAHPLPARLRRPLRARPRGRGAPPRRLPHGDAQRRCAHRRSVSPACARRCSPRRADRLGVRAAARRCDRCATSCATAASPSSCPSRSARVAPTRRLADGEALRDAARARYGYRDDAAEVELVTVRVSVWGAAPSCDRRRAAGSARRRAPRSSSTASRSRPSSCAASPPASRLVGPALCALPEATLLIHPAGRRGRRVGTARDRDRERRERSTRSSCRSCRRPARRLRGDGRPADPLRPLGEHQGAPRRLDRAVRRRPARWSCRPSTSPCTWARCPPPSRRCSTSATRRASPGSSTTPSPAAPTCPTSPSSRPSSPRRVELLGFAASRAHHADVGGRMPGSMPADSRTLEEEGVVIAPARSTSGRSTSSSRADAPARRAPRRPARPARGQPGRRAAPARARRAARAARLRDATDAVLDYAERRTRACLAAMPDGDASGRGRARGARGRPRAAPARDRRRASG